MVMLQLVFYFYRWDFIYFLQEKRGKNFQDKYTEDMSDNIEKVNDLLIGNYEYNYVTSSNALRKVRKKSNEKKINFEIKN